MMTESLQANLIQRAIEARNNAYAPYSKFLVDDGPAGKALAADLKEGVFQYSKHAVRKVVGGDLRTVYDCDQIQIPAALWGHINNNDCNAINPLGNGIAQPRQRIRAGRNFLLSGNMSLDVNVTCRIGQ